MLDIQAYSSGSHGNCYRVSDNTTPLLLECGIRYRKIQEALNFQVSALGGVLISHEHGDHSKACEKLMRAGIDCYMSQGTAEALRVKSHRFIKVELEKQFEINSWIIKPLKAKHDAVEPINFLLYSRETSDKLVYLTDTFYTQYTFENLNYIMVECNYSKDILNKNVKNGRVSAVQKNRLVLSHFGLENVKDFLASNDLSQVREIWLLHLSDDNSDAARFKREIQQQTGKPVYIAGDEHEAS